MNEKLLTPLARADIATELHPYTDARLHERDSIGRRLHERVGASHRRLARNRESRWLSSHGRVHPDEVVACSPELMLVRERKP